MNILTPNHSYPCYILQDVSGLDNGSNFEINNDEYSLNQPSPPRQQSRPSATHSHLSAMTGMLSGLSSICADDDDNLREQLQALKAKLKEKDSQIETLRADLQAALAEASAEADAVLADEEVGVEEAAAAAEEEAPPSLPLFRGDPETGCIHDGTSSTDILLMAGINVQLLSEKVGLLRCTSFSYHCIFVSYHYSSLSLILQELKFPVKGLAQPIGMTKETFESFISDPSQFIRPFKGVPTAAVDELMREGVPLIKAELQHLFNRFYANQLLGKAYSTVSDPQEAMRMVLLKLRAGYIPSLICIEDFYNHKVTEVRIRQHNPRAVALIIPPLCNHTLKAFTFGCFHKPFRTFLMAHSFSFNSAGSANGSLYNNHAMTAAPLRPCPALQWTYTRDPCDSCFCIKATAFFKSSTLGSK